MGLLINHYLHELNTDMLYAVHEKDLVAAHSAHRAVRDFAEYVETLANQKESYV